MAERADRARGSGRSAPTVVAIVPMRHHSERVAGKNYRPFAGRPLFHHITETLTACPEITRVMLDTDSDVILEDAARTFPGVVLYRRPAELRDGMIPMNDVLLNSVAQIEADYYVQTHSTNPLLRSATIGRAIRTFIESLPGHDSLFSVTRMQSRFWTAALQPINHDPARLARTQDLEPVFEENSCLYLFSAESLKERGNRIGRNPMMFEIDRFEAQDIDCEHDFRIAEALYREFCAAETSSK